MLPRMEDRQVAHLILTQSLAQRTGYIERGTGTALSLEACERLNNGGQCAFEKGLEIEGVAEEDAFFGSGCPSDSLKLQITVPPTGTSTLIDRGRGSWTASVGYETDVRLSWQQDKYTHRRR